MNSMTRIISRALAVSLLVLVAACSDSSDGILYKDDLPTAAAPEAPAPAPGPPAPPTLILNQRLTPRIPPTPPVPQQNELAPFLTRSGFRAPDVQFVPCSAYKGGMGL